MEESLVQIIAELSDSVDDLSRLSMIIKADLVRLETRLVSLGTLYERVVTTGDADND